MVSIAKTTSILALCGALVVGGCTANKQGVGTVVGGVGGAVAGNAIGRAVGGTNAAILGTVLGGIVGAAAGNAIGAELDEADRLRAQQATYNALEAPVYGSGGQQISWNSQQNQGVYGSSQVVDTGKTAAGYECRRVREVAYVQGREIQQDNVYCRDGQGRWVAQG